MIPLSPAVADARPLIDDQRIDALLIEARSNREPCLRAADHEDRGLSILIRDCLPSHVRPVVAAEIPRVRGAARSIGPDFLLMTRQRVQRGRHEPGLYRAAIFGR